MQAPLSSADHEASDWVAGDDDKGCACCFGVLVITLSALAYSLWRWIP